MSQTGDVWDRQVGVYAEFPTLVARLLADHVDDGAGRCSSNVCLPFRAGWPCRLSLVADAAAAIIRSRRRTA